MQKVPIKLARPGMVLARTVCNDTGMVLCGEGTELTDTIIERLKHMNVTHLVLAGRPVDMGDAKTAEQKLAELEERFVNVRGNPIMERVLEAARVAIKAIDAERAMGEPSQEGSS